MSMAMIIFIIHVRGGKDGEKREGSEKNVVQSKKGVGTGRRS